MQKMLTLPSGNPLHSCRACQLQQHALADLEAAAQQCNDLQAQLDAVRAEFQRYQAVKAVEVRLLEQRVLRQLGPGSGGAGSSGNGAAQGRGSGPGAAGAAPAGLDDLEAATRDEAISAALREARLERLQRQQLEVDLAAARAAEEQVGQLRGKARAAEQELSAARSKLATERERAERLAAELADCQAALRLAKTEGGRRLKELQALQRAVAGSENSGPNAAALLEGEREARKAAEAQLREARQALARKAELIRDLRGKVRRGRRGNRCSPTMCSYMLFVIIFILGSMFGDFTKTLAQLEILSFSVSAFTCRWPAWSVSWPPRTLPLWQQSWRHAKRGCARRRRHAAARRQQSGSFASVWSSRPGRCLLPKGGNGKFQFDQNVPQG